MPERRYSRYKRAEVMEQVIELQESLQIKIVLNSLYGGSVKLRRLEKREDHRAVVLARSSDWYGYSLNTFNHAITAIVAGTHDSCVPVPVLALDAGRWYDPLKMRADWGSLQPQFDAQGQMIPDFFEQHRRSQYGHNMLIGALMCGRSDAQARLATFRRSTRLRIEAEIHRLHKRRVGHPLTLIAS